MVRFHTIRYDYVLYSMILYHTHTYTITYHSCSSETEGW